MLSVEYKYLAYLLISFLNRELLKDMDKGLHPRKQWGVVTHPRSNFNDGVDKALLKLGHIYVIACYINFKMP